ncbi:hypothetical protein GGF46_005076 [Coemansia sp. RSA 552]|nr:hypothetical protein GGF46_005076 [Coemansia sp. RSA 552]
MNTSAASCFEYSDDGTPPGGIDYKVVYGRDFEDTRGTVDVTEYIRHPAYDPTTYANNIAVVRFKGEVNIEEDIILNFANIPSEWPSRYGFSYQTLTEGNNAWNPREAIFIGPADQNACAQASWLFHDNQQDFICITDDLPSMYDRGDCKLPFKDVTAMNPNEDGSSAQTKLGFFSHSMVYSAGGYCGGGQKFHYYLMVANYIPWINSKIGAEVQVATLGGQDPTQTDQNWSMNNPEDLSSNDGSPITLYNWNERAPWPRKWTTAQQPAAEQPQQPQKPQQPQPVDDPEETTEEEEETPEVEATTSTRTTTETVMETITEDGDMITVETTLISTETERETTTQELTTTVETDVISAVTETETVTETATSIATVTSTLTESAAVTQTDSATTMETSTLVSISTCPTVEKCVRETDVSIYTVSQTITQPDISTTTTSLVTITPSVISPDNNQYTLTASIYTPSETITETSTVTKTRPANADTTGPVLSTTTVTVDTTKLETVTEQQDTGSKEKPAEPSDDSSSDEEEPEDDGSDSGNLIVIIVPVILAVLLLLALLGYLWYRWRRKQLTPEQKY